MPTAMTTWMRRSTELPPQDIGVPCHQPPPPPDARIPHHQPPTPRTSGSPFTSPPWDTGIPCYQPPPPPGHGGLPSPASPPPWDIRVPCHQPRPGMLGSPVTSPPPPPRLHPRDMGFPCHQPPPACRWHLCSRDGAGGGGHTHTHNPRLGHPRVLAASGGGDTHDPQMGHEDTPLPLPPDLGGGVATVVGGVGVGGKDNPPALSPRQQWVGSFILKAVLGVMWGPPHPPKLPLALPPFCSSFLTFVVF